MINLSPSGLKMPNIGLVMGQIIFIKLALKILKLDVQILKLSLFNSFIVHGKKEYLNASVLQEYVVICTAMLYWYVVLLSEMDKKKPLSLTFINFSKNTL